MFYDDYINSIIMNSRKVPTSNYNDINNELKKIEKEESEIENEIEKQNRKEIKREYDNYYPEIYICAIPMIKEELKKYEKIDQESLNKIVDTIYSNLEDNYKDVDYEVTLKELFKIIIIDYIKMYN